MSDEAKKMLEVELTEARSRLTQLYIELNNTKCIKKTDRLRIEIEWLDIQIRELERKRERLWLS